MSLLTPRRTASIRQSAGFGGSRSRHKDCLTSIGILKGEGALVLPLLLLPRPDLATKEKVVLVSGNTNGVASVEDNLTVAEVEVIEEAEMAQFHTVESGDTLGKIAKNYYGNAMKYPVIFEANKPMLSHPDKIYPGQVLRIPPLVD